MEVIGPKNDEMNERGEEKQCDIFFIYPSGPANVVKGEEQPCNRSEHDAEIRHFMPECYRRRVTR